MLKFLRSLAQSSLSLMVWVVIAVGSAPTHAEPSAIRKVPGTAVQILPPEGFQPSQLFAGFEQKKTGASLIVIEMPIPKEAVPKLFEQLNSATALKSKGMRLLESKDITISGISGKLLLISQSNRGVTFLKWVAIAADRDRALIVNAPFPDSQSATLKEPLRRAILSLTWTPEQPVSKLEGLPFVFQVAGDLQVSDRIFNGVVLTRKGAKPPIPASEPFLILASAYSNAQIEDIAAFSRMRLKAMPQVRGLTEASGSAKTISGNPAFELVAQGYDLKTNTPLTIYQVVMTANQTYYILQGLVPTTKAQTYLPIFRAVTNSFVPKHF